MNKIFKKVCSLLLLTPFIATANEPDTYFLIDTQNNQGIQLNSPNFSMEDLDKLNEYADQRNLQVVIPSENLKILNSKDNSQLQALIEELSEILEGSVTIKSVDVMQMSLSTQAGGVPGN